MCNEFQQKFCIQSSSVITNYVARFATFETDIDVSCNLEYAGTQYCSLLFIFYKSSQQSLLISLIFIELINFNCLSNYLPSHLAIMGIAFFSNFRISSTE